MQTTLLDLSSPQEVISEASFLSLSYKVSTSVIDFRSCLFPQRLEATKNLNTSELYRTTEERWTEQALHLFPSMHPVNFIFTAHSPLEFLVLYLYLYIRQLYIIFD